LLSETDRPDNNFCCERIDVPWKDEARLGVHCFTVESNTSVWEICGTTNLDQATVEAFRQ